MDINTNRIITIKRSANPNSTWGTAFTDLMSNSEEKNSLGKLVNFSDVNSDPKITPLLMETIPKIKIDNGYEAPINEVVKGLSQKNQNLNKYIKYGQAIINTIAGMDGDSSEPAPTWYPWMKNIPAWNGNNSTLTFTYTFKFAMGQYGLWNARKEVVLPILNLAAPTLPRHLSSFTMTGPFPNMWDLVTNIIYKAIYKPEEYKGTGNKWLEKVGTALESLLLDDYKNYTFDVQFGNIYTFFKCLMKGSEINFSNEVDNNGDPVSGEIAITFMSVIPPSLTSTTSDNIAIRYGGN